MGGVASASEAMPPSSQRWRGPRSPGPAFATLPLQAGRSRRRGAPSTRGAVSIRYTFVDVGPSTCSYSKLHTSTGRDGVRAQESGAVSGAAPLLRPRWAAKVASHSLYRALARTGR